MPGGRCTPLYATRRISADISSSKSVRGLCSTQGKPTRSRHVANTNLRAVDSTLPDIRRSIKQGGSLAHYFFLSHTTLSLLLTSIYFNSPFTHPTHHRLWHNLHSLEYMFSNSLCSAHNSHRSVPFFAPTNQPVGEVADGHSGVAHTSAADNRAVY
jgi:hypothetical protein